MNKKQKKMLARILIAAALMIMLHFVPAEGAVRFLLYMIPYLVIGYDILIKAFKGICNRQVFDESFLMAVATVGAIALAITRQRGLHGGHRRHAVLSGGRMVPELCGGQEPPQHQRADGHPP